MIATALRPSRPSTSGSLSVRMARAKSASCRACPACEIAAGSLDPPDAPVFWANRWRISRSATVSGVNSQRNTSSCSITTVPRSPWTAMVFGNPGCTLVSLPGQTGTTQTGSPPAAEMPEPGVLIVRDPRFQVPRIYGDTRAEAMWAAGYVTAEDRLFFMDVLRHTAEGTTGQLLGPRQLI